LFLVFYFVLEGFGFTLRGNSDFNLSKFLAGTPETFDTYYGVRDINGDGDIFKSENIDALQNYVNKCTMGNGVHMVMADGVRLRRKREEKTKEMYLLI
jgi:cap1 methyltransferase